MKIGIDARIWGTKHTGIGRYVEQLINNLKEIDKENEYILFIRREDICSIHVPSNWKIIVADIPHYSIKEQLYLPFIYSNAKLDLLHVPHYNVPILYWGKYVITVHDLILHNYKGIQNSTLSWPVYFIKYIAYLFVVKFAIKRAVKIITPSLTVKDDLVKRFNLVSNKVEVTYEGVSLPTTDSKIEKIRKHMLYVGNLYPHKNVETLVKALIKIKNEKLIIVCGRNIFLEKFEIFLEKVHAKNIVEIRIGVTDSELSKLYRGSKVFIFPSLAEGFGLPGLEAMQFGAPVACSNIPVFREIYKDAAYYFNPNDENDIKEKLEGLLQNTVLQQELIDKGNKLVKKYSWFKMAKETYSIYASCVSIR